MDENMKNFIDDEGPLAIRDNTNSLEETEVDLNIGCSSALCKGMCKFPSRITSHFAQKS